MTPGVDQIWYVEADGYVALDLTPALVNGHDELEPPQVSCQCPRRCCLWFA